MPLVIVCGFPLAGKSAAAVCVQRAAVARGMRAVVVGLDAAGVDPAGAFASAAATRRAHRVLRAEVTRRLARDPARVVVCDFYNHVRGFRYELYCAAREARTAHAVVWANTSLHECRGRNDALHPPRLAPALLDDIASRFEPPLAGARWDAPLFVCTGADDLDTDALLDALTRAKPPRTSLATAPPQAPRAQLGAALAAATQTVVTEVLDAVASGAYFPGDVVRGTRFSLRIPRFLSAPELYAARRRFLALQQALASQPPRGAAASWEQAFADFLLQ